MDALELDSLQVAHRRHLLLAHVFNRSVACRVKNKLLQLYQPSYPVKIIRFTGQPRERVDTVTVGTLERSGFSEQTILYLPPAGGYSLADLVEIMARLRSTAGCPWDREQTHRSLRQYLVEEA